MRTSRRSIRPPLLLLALALLLASTGPLAAAQDDAAAPAAGAFADVVDVRVVNVEVVVTDRQGRRLDGLEAADFRLFVDGEEVPIDYFSEVEEGSVVQQGDGAAEPAVPSAGAGEPVTTSYLVFVDDYFSIARDRNDQLEEIETDLALLGPRDRMAVVAFDGREVELLTSWTRSAEEIARAFDTARERPAYGLRRLGELRAHDRSLAGRQTARFNDSIEQLNTEDRFFAIERANQVERTVSAAAATLRGLAGVEGRKVMMLLSGGWPFSPGGYAAGQRSVVLTGEVPSGLDLLRPLVDTANLVGYTVYPVDVPGLAPATGPDVERGGLVVRNANSVTFNEFAPGISIDREGNLEDTLRVLARETGGTPLINARSHGAFAHVVDDTRSYYWLGFSPDRQRDDERHRIRVEVDRPGARVRARSSFLDLSRDAQRTMAVESTLLFGASGPGGLAVEAGEVERVGFRRVEVPLDVHIPTALLTPVQEGDEWVARAELRAGAVDGASRRSDVPAVPVEFRFPDKPDPDKAVRYTARLRLRRADQTVVVHVTDVLTGTTATGRVDVAP